MSTQKSDQSASCCQFLHVPIQAQPIDTSSYRQTTDVAALVHRSVLHPGYAEIFQAKGKPLSLYKHQEQSIALAAQGESFVVTTGTGSGKSLCFFISIVDYALKTRSAGRSPRTCAIVVYPMNALANSQLEELGKFMANAREHSPVTFARYTGQEDSSERQRIAENPPDILLTNFMMLELLMTRQDKVDRTLEARAGSTYPRAPLQRTVNSSWPIRPTAERWSGEISKKLSPASGRPTLCSAQAALTSAALRSAATGFFGRALSLSTVITSGLRNSNSVTASCDSVRPRRPYA